MTMQWTNPILGRATTVMETGVSRGAWSLVRCTETGFVFLANPPEYSQLETEFAWEKTAQAERSRRQESEPLVARVSTIAKKAKVRLFPSRNKIASMAISTLQSHVRTARAKVLDIGCGCGSLMAQIHHRASERGVEVVPIGIEVSRSLALESQSKVERLGGTVFCASAIEGLAQLEDRSIHLAVMSSFLEHESQPLELLKRLHCVLADDGWIVLKVPNYASWNRRLRGARWCGYRFPDHVNYFTPQTLRRLASEAQFESMHQSWSDRLPLSDNMYAVLSKRSA